MERPSGESLGRAPGAARARVRGGRRAARVRRRRVRAARGADRARAGRRVEARRRRRARGGRARGRARRCTRRRQRRPGVWGPPPPAATSRARWCRTRRWTRSEGSAVAAAESPSNVEDPTTPRRAPSDKRKLNAEAKAARGARLARTRWRLSSRRPAAATRSRGEGDPSPAAPSASRRASSARRR